MRLSLQGLRFGRRSRRALYGLTALLGVYTVYWVVVATLIGRGVDGWMTQQRARGVVVETADFSVGGYPIRFTTNAQNFSVARADGLVLRGESLAARAWPWSPNVMDISLDGGLLLSLPVAPNPAPLLVTARQGDGEVRAALSGGLAEARLGLNGVAVEGMLAGRMTIDRTEFTMMRGTAAASGGLDLIALAQRIAIAGAPTTNLGPTINLAAFEATVTEPVPIPARQMTLEAWRDAGGVVRVHSLVLNWGPLTISAQGTLALDPTLQPRGRLNAEIRGYAEAISALMAAGVVGRTEGGFATMALNVLAGPPGPDGNATLRAPLAIENGTLSLGGIPLGPVPRVIWPG